MANVERQPLIDFLAQTFKTDAAKDFSGDRLYKALEQGEPFWKNYAASHHITIPQGWMAALEQKAATIVHPLPGMQQLVSELNEQGYRVALLSNTTHARSEFFRKQGYYAGFDPILLSWQVKVKKPNPKIYELMLKMLNLPAKDCLFIDNEARNIIAAKQLGMDGIVFKSPQQLRAELLKRSIPQSNTRRNEQSAAQPSAPPKP